MKRWIYAVVTLALISLPCHAVELKLPERVEGAPATFISVKAETLGKVVKWKALDPGLSVFPAELLKDSKTAVVVAATKGKYRLLAVTAAADEPSEPAITIIDTTGGKPTPPTPPDGPTPPDPVVPDALVKAIQSAYAGTRDPEALEGLKAFYAEAGDADFLASIKTWKHLHDTLGSAAAKLGIKGKLPAVQGILAGEMKKAGFKSADSTESLDANAREQILKTFSTFARALGTLS